MSLSLFDGYIRNISFLNFAPLCHVLLYYFCSNELCETWLSVFTEALPGSSPLKGCCYAQREES